MTTVIPQTGIDDLDGDVRGHVPAAGRSPSTRIDRTSSASTDRRSPPGGLCAHLQADRCADPVRLGFGQVAAPPAPPRPRLPLATNPTKPTPASSAARSGPGSSRPSSATTTARFPARVAWTRPADRSRSPPRPRPRRSLRRSGWPRRRRPTAAGSVVAGRSPARRRSDRDWSTTVAPGTSGNASVSEGQYPEQHGPAVGESGQRGRHAPTPRRRRHRRIPPSTRRRARSRHRPAAPRSVAPRGRRSRGRRALGRRSARRSAPRRAVFIRTSHRGPSGGPAWHPRLVTV